MNQATGARIVTLIAIGAGKGIRLPRTLLRRYGWSYSVVLEEMESGIFLRDKKRDKLSWEETYRAVASAQEDWSEFDFTVADGIG